MKGPNPIILHSAYPLGLGQIRKVLIRVRIAEEGLIQTLGLVRISKKQNLVVISCPKISACKKMNWVIEGSLNTTMFCDVQGVSGRGEGVLN